MARQNEQDAPPLASSHRATDFPSESSSIVLLVGVFIGVGSSLSLLLGYQFAAETLGPGLGLLILLSALLSGAVAAVFMMRRWVIARLSKHVDGTLRGLIAPLNEAVSELQGGRWTVVVDAGHRFVQGFVVWNARRSMRAWVVGVVLTLLAAVAGAFGSYLLHAQNALVEKQNEFFQKQIRWSERESQIAREAQLIATLYDEVPCPQDASSKGQHPQRCPRASIRARARAAVALREIICARASHVQEKGDPTAPEKGCGLDLSDVNLVDAALEGADFSFARLSGAKLDRSNLRDARFDGASLKKARFAEADLEGAQLGAADLTDVEAQGAQMLRANLRRAILSSANLEAADLSGALLDDANLQNAALDGADLTGASLKRARLVSAKLTDTDLTRANLTGVDLTGADLSHADLSGARLDGASLKGALFEGTRFNATTRWPGKKIPVGAVKID